MDLCFYNGGGKTKAFAYQESSNFAANGNRKRTDSSGKNMANGACIGCLRYCYTRSPARMLIAFTKVILSVKA